ncbi:MAG: hypothetical protein QOG80_3493 [Pseudonocardiales bacterium]|jgi:hypothetical protein|nr:hypothetical protein [Pseudonocardiales bacterium]
MALGVGGCTTSATTSVIDSTHTTVETITPSTDPAGPLDARPIVASDAPSCPLLSAANAAEDGGMRLARIQVLRRGSAVVGCRFYAIQGSSLATSEHLPGPNQPVIEITSAKYATHVAASNALVRIARKGTEPNQYPIAGSVVGVAYRATFDPGDGARDWSVGFAKNTTLVVVRTASDVTSLNALTLARAVFARF